MKTSCWPLLAVLLFPLAFQGGKAKGEKEPAKTLARVKKPIKERRSQ
jgi:hypothetical protein